MQQIFIVGNLGGEPRVKTTASGRNVMSFSVAVNQGDGKVCWYSVVMTAIDKLLPYLTKGRCVAVAGDFKPDTYKGDLDLTIYANELTLCGGGEDKNPPQAPIDTTQDPPKGETF